MLASVRFRLKTRHAVTLLLLGVVLLIPNAQSLPLSSQSLIKMPKSTNPSDSVAEGATATSTSTSNQSIPADWPSWRAHIATIPALQVGCFMAIYPSAVWQATECVTAPLIPLRPSPATVGGASSAVVGNGNDEVAYSPSGKLIGSSIGSFQISGLTTETDSLYGTNNYGLQVNSQTFTTSTTYTGGKSTTGWEQFVWINWPYANSVGYGYIQYWLLGYHSAYGSCPNTGPPSGSPWMASSGDCYANSQGFATPLEVPTNLASLSLEGFSNYNGAGVDVDMFCVSGGGCYSVSITDQVVNLYQNWQYSEFNVFGVGSASEAKFNAGTSITVLNSLKDQNGNVITPSCVNTGYTGETNNLNLGSCSSNSSNGQITFTESNLVTTQSTTTTTSITSTLTSSTSTSLTITTTTTTTTSTSTVGQLCYATSTTQTTSVIIQGPTTTSTTTTSTTSTFLTTTSSTSTSTSVTATTTTTTACTQTSTSATTSTTLTTFTRPSTSITLAPSSGSETVGSSVTLSGSISPNPGAVAVTISFSRDSGTTWVMLMSVVTDNSGSYSAGWTPPTPGSYRLEASWSGNNQLAGSTSSSIPLTVTGTTTPTPTLLLSNPTTATQGQLITLSVTVFNPTSSPLNANVTVQITGPGNYVSFVVIPVQVAASSQLTSYYDWTVPSQAGTYTVNIGLLSLKPGGVDTGTVQPVTATIQVT